jgi:aryl-alcohol dehydrogenase-like predicted oxidoreductase
MEYRRLGRSGLEVSVIGLGGNTFGMYCDERQTADIVSAALDSGINTIDTADVYGNRGDSETFVGKAIAGRRHDFVLMTKFASAMGEGPNIKGASRGYMRKAVEASLKRLGTDYIDVYQVHWPDPETPLEETMSGLHDLVTAGLVRYVGCSNYASWQIAESNWLAKHYGWTPLISSQPRYNVIDRAMEREHIPACLQYGLGLIPWSPLAGGFLTGKHRRGQDPVAGTRMEKSAWARGILSDRNFDRLEALEPIAKDRGLTMTQLAIGWLAAQPVVSTIIVGATSPDQVRENAAAGEVQLSTDDLAAINEASPL